VTGGGVVVGTGVCHLGFGLLKWIDRQSSSVGRNRTEKIEASRSRSHAREGSTACEAYPAD
jgi:hypothetical protein